MLKKLSNIYEYDAFIKHNSKAIVLFGLSNSNITLRVEMLLNEYITKHPEWVTSFIDYDENKILAISNSIRKLPTIDIFIDGAFRKRISMVNNYDELETTINSI